MDQLLYWLDRVDWLAALRDVWQWIALMGLLVPASLAGIILIARRYDGAPRRAS